MSTTKCHVNCNSCLNVPYSTTKGYLYCITCSSGNGAFAIDNLNLGINKFIYKNKKLFNNYYLNYLGYGSCTSAN